jgi:superfamily II DNA or RNA helicase
VSIRNSSAHFLKAMVSAGTEKQKAQCNSILDLIAKIAERWLQAYATSSSGHHSFETFIKSYSACSVIGSERRQFKIPDMKMQTMVTLVDVMETITGLPVEKCAHSDRAGIAFSLRAHVPLKCYLFDARGHNVLGDVNCIDSLFQMLAEGSPRKPINDFQELLIRSLLDVRQQDVLVVAGCGSGKTLGVTLPFACTPGYRMVLIVTPLRCLLDSMLPQLRAYGFDANEFDHMQPRFKTESFSNGSRNHSELSPEFVLCVTDALETNELIRFLITARFAGHLQAVIIDEAHQVIVSSTFRPVMKRVSVLRGLSVPFIMVSGTCPPSMEYSVLASLKSSAAACLVLRSVEDPTFTRRKISLVQVKNPVRATVKLLLQNCVGRTLVFCMTKAQSVEVAKQIANCIKAARVIQLDSESSPEHRQLVLRCVTSLDMNNIARPLIVVSTKVLAEGVDAVDFNRVIVVGGAHAGIVDLVQMFGRGGRGSGVVQVEAVFFYDPVYVLNVAFQAQQRLMVASDSANVCAFMSVDRTGVERIVTCEGLSDLFQRKLAYMCGRVALKSLMEPTLSLESTPSLSCGNCNRCQKERWHLAVLLSDLVAEEQRPTPKQNKESSKEGVALMENLRNLPQPSTAREEQTLMNTVITNLKGLSKNCIVCSSLGTSTSEHFPNLCATLVSQCFLVKCFPRSRCFNCFNPGHDLKEKENALKQTLSADEKRSNPILKSCAVVFSEHQNYRTFKPCTECWLQHSNVGESGGCATTKHSVRACFLLIWHSNKHLNMFVDQMRRTKVLSEARSFKNWTQFMEWGVYEGGLEVQNAYRVIAYVLSLKGL